MTCWMPPACNGQAILALSTIQFVLFDPVADALRSRLKFFRQLFRTPPRSGQFQNLLAIFRRIGCMGLGHFLAPFPKPTTVHQTGSTPDCALDGLCQSRPAKPPQTAGAGTGGTPQLDPAARSRPAPVYGASPVAGGRGRPSGTL